MQLCFCLYFCVHFLTRPLNRIDNDNVRNEPHTRTRRPAEFKRGMHQTNNDILWFGNERRVITYLLVLMHANTRNKFRNQCEQKYCCGGNPESRHSIKSTSKHPSWICMIFYFIPSHKRILKCNILPFFKYKIH